MVSQARSVVGSAFYLRLALWRGLAEELGLFQCCLTYTTTISDARRYTPQRVLTVLDELLLVLHDGNVLLGKVLDLAPLDLPELIGDL